MPVLPDLVTEMGTRRGAATDRSRASRLAGEAGGLGSGTGDAAGKYDVARGTEGFDAMGAGDGIIIVGCEGEREGDGLMLVTGAAAKR